MASGKLLERSRIDRVPIQVHRHDRGRARCACCRRRRGIHERRIRIDINRDQSRSALHHRQPGRDERVGRHDHFIPGTDAIRAQCDREGVEPVAESDRMPRAAETGNSRSKCSSSSPRMYRPESMTLVYADWSSSRSDVCRADVEVWDAHCPDRASAAAR